MKKTDVLINEIIAKMQHIEIDRPEEALQVGNMASENIAEDADPNLVLALDYHRTRIAYLLGKTERVVENLVAITSRSEEIGNDDILSRAYNLLGNAYSDLGLLDRGVESFISAMKIAERIRFYTLMGNAANNIGSLYYDLGDYSRAEEFYRIALNSIEPGALDLPSDRLKGILWLNLSEIAMRRGDFTQALNLIEEGRVYANRHGLRLIQAHFLGNEAQARQYLGDPTVAKVRFLEARTIYMELESRMELAVSTIPFVKSILETQSDELSIEDYSFLIENLEHSEAWIKERSYHKQASAIHELLAKIYMIIGNPVQAVNHYRNYEQHRKALDEEARKQQLNVLHIRFELEKSVEEKEIVQRKNVELKRKSEELLKKKEALEQAYQRIQIISEIGQKITSTLDLNEILISVYDNLKTQMLIDSFYMAVLNDEKTHLVSVASVENLVYEKTFEVPVDNENSLLAICYRERKTLFIPDILNETSLKNWEFIRSSTLDIRSVMAVPLLYDDEVVGVCSVQASLSNAYEATQLDILNALSTYLAIAINNAQKSKRLEQEIQMRLRTQRELERLNSELRSISEIDGLTKVPNRRRFENVYDQMFEIALSQEHMLHVLMMDIDFFKVYNDHYGHLKGDEVLIAVAQKLNQAFRFKGRLFARYGGEEFVAVLSEMSKEEAIVLAQELRIAVSNLGIFHELSPTGFLTISIGVASMVPTNENDLRRLLHVADECLYKSKNNGRNRVESTDLT